MPAECGGGTTPPLLSIALRLQTARGKSALVASVATGGAGAIACASCVIGRDQNARGWAHERRWGEVWRVGMGWAAYRKTLIFECPSSFI